MIDRIRTAALAVLVGGFVLARPAPVPAQDGEPATQPEAPGQDTPVPKKPRRKPAAAKPAPVPAEPATPMAAQPMPEPAAPPNLTVLCEGKSARYTADTGAAVWVTRSGVVSVDNPLRPLTPDTTRVLQVVVGDRAATAYGPDLAALRRGGTPASLEARLGAAIRWDEVLPLLPDAFVVVSEAGETVARLPFKDCAEAPAVKADPVTAKPASKSPPKPRRAKPEGEATAPKGLQIPQGAIPGNP
ncbi:hypothetical protein [Methylobacterium sp. Leaf108]|uniref:hypothetical protein n=1 Tax=Methylobacterium sp. Leaf108 TaxID=1736256 RepID=UPI000A6248E7|nr:hypothetical protein [Methylobacterium sp. Leaf108]